MAGNKTDTTRGKSQEKQATKKSCTHAKNMNRKKKTLIKNNTDSIKQPGPHCATITYVRIL